MVTYNKITLTKYSYFTKKVQCMLNWGELLRRTLKEANISTNGNGAEGHSSHELRK